MRVAVTGSGGFVGGAVTKLFLQQGHSVVGLGRRSGIQVPGMEYVQCDLAKSDLRRIFESVDVVVHCAGQAHASNATDDDYKTNIVVATDRIIRSLIDIGRPTTLVNLSSIKAMGEELSPESDERTICVPTTVYGKAKLEAEAIAKSGAPKIGTVVTLRPSPVFGPGGKGIIGLLSSVGSRGLLPRITAPTGVRSYVHVDDLSRAILMATGLNPGSHTYCVSDGQRYTLSDVQACLSDPRPWSKLLPPISPPLLRFAQIGPWGKKLRLQDRLLSDCHVSPSLLISETGWKPIHFLARKA